MKPLKAAEISDRLELAALTLKRLPNPTGSGARGYGSSWPDVARDAHADFMDTAPQLRVVPSAHEIHLMEEALGWLSYLKDPLDRRILWMRAENHRWRAICHRVGLVRQTCHRRAIAAVLTIEKNLDRKHRIALGGSLTAPSGKAGR